MAGKPRQTAPRLTPETPVPVVDLEAVPEQEVTAAEEEAEDIEGVISQVDDQAATVQIKRRDPDDPTKWTYLGVIPAREFSLERIKQAYGGGEYKVVTFDRNRRYVKGGSHQFQIDRMFKPAAQAQPQGAPSAALSPETQAINAKLDKLIDALQSQHASKETLDTALKIAAVMKGGSAVSPTEMFNVFEKGLNFSDRLRDLSGGGGEGGNGGGGGDTDPVDVAIRSLAGSIGKLLESEV